LLRFQTPSSPVKDRLMEVNTFEIKLTKGISILLANITKYYIGMTKLITDCAMLIQCDTLATFECYHTWFQNVLMISIWYHV
jgi:hypothetical protein